MRSAPIDMLGDVVAAINSSGLPDLLWCSDMLDLPTFLGCAAAERSVFPRLLEVPRLIYFHENQWQYPTAPDARVDHHYGFTNLLSASVADASAFNSHFNRETFLASSRAFLSRMPDARTAVDLQRIERTSKVIRPGFQPPPRSDRQPWHSRPLRIGWVGRFEHDKRPDRFLQLLHRLADRDLAFELILLGQRGRNVESLDELHDRFAANILFDGYASTRQQYEAQLARMDVVVSTADHEFFGVAICEAIWSGALPVTPDALAYPEYIPDDLRFGVIEQAVDIILALKKRRDVQMLRDRSRDAIAAFRSDQVVCTVDQWLESHAK